MLRKHNIRASADSEPRIRTRRTYFDTRFGQLHVRTAFPATGGFDEQPPLICIHAAGCTSRDFGAFLAAIADRRSVYAPDLPGCGESDPAPPASAGGAAAAAIRDLTAELRLRRIDMLAVGDAAAVALEVAAAAPELLRRLVTIGAGEIERIAATTYESLVLAVDPAGEPTWRGLQTLRASVEYVEAPEYRDRPFVLAPAALAERVAHFLGRS